MRPAHGARTEGDRTGENRGHVQRFEGQTGPYHIDQRVQAANFVEMHLLWANAMDRALGDGQAAEDLLRSAPGALG